MLRVVENGSSILVTFKCFDGHRHPKGLQVFLFIWADLQEAFFPAPQVFFFFFSMSIKDSICSFWIIISQTLKNMLVDISHLSFHWKKKIFPMWESQRYCSVQPFDSSCLCNCLFNEFTWPKMSTKWHCRFSQEDVFLFFFF